MLKIVIFDCDGVLFDSREANRAYYNHLLERFACPLMDEDELDYVHTHNVIDSVAHIFRNHHQVPKDIVDQYRTEVDYAPYLKYMIMEPDLLDFLRLIKPRYHTAISTNRTTTMPLLLESHQLTPWFDQVVTAMDTKRPKPAPDALHMILDNFGLKVEEAIYVGDSEVDRQHAGAIGMDLVAFKNPGLAAKYHVDNFMAIAGLPPFLER